MTGVVVPARDGLELPCYLSLPVLPDGQVLEGFVASGEVRIVISWSVSGVWGRRGEGSAQYGSRRCSLNSQDSECRCHVECCVTTCRVVGAVRCRSDGLRHALLQEPKHLPLVLNVHGGPWARDVWGYRPDVQWFTNRGYAVLQVLGQVHAA